MRAEAARRPGLWRAFGAALGRALFRNRARYRLERLGEPHGAQRAATLLVRCLDDAQRAEFRRMRAFTVRSQSGRRYRISYSATANIDVLDAKGEVLYRLCARPLYIPVPAIMLSQKLMLETQEAEFLRVAVRHEAFGGGPMGLVDCARV
jgi:hypothetical protein